MYDDVMLFEFMTVVKKGKDGEGEGAVERWDAEPCVEEEEIEGKLR